MACESLRRVDATLTIGTGSMWLYPEANLVVYDTPDQRVREKIVDAKDLHNGYVAMPATLYNLQIMRYLGHPVPPIMDQKYDWPRNKRFIPEPFVSQRTTANFLALNPRAFCLSDMGTGKTLAALWAADYVMQQYEPGKCRCLIVAPLSTLQRVWADAIFQNFLGKRKCTVLHGDADTRRRLLSLPADFYIINYDGCKVLERELFARLDIRMAVIDEASAYKDRTTRRHRIARNIIATKDYLWLMTGTPTPNGARDAYGQAKLVNNCYGESYAHFEDRVTFQQGPWKRVDKVGAHTQAHKLLQPAIRFAIEDCVDLPPCTVQKRDVELSAEQAKAYKEMKRDLVLQVKQGPITAVNEAVLRMKLIQIACGAVYGNSDSGGRAVHRLDCNPRISALREVMEQCNEKIIIFAPLTSVCNMLISELRKDYTVELVNGEVSQKARNEIFRAFQQDEAPRVLVADPGTMAHGLTLTAASTIIWFAPTDKTELYLQANKRIDRPGQVHNTSIIQLAATPIEREIYRRLENNETMMGLLLQMTREHNDE